jgi:hypothetical protein
MVACRQRESFERLQSTDACTLVVAPITPIIAAKTGAIKIVLYDIFCMFLFFDLSADTSM